MSEVNPAALSLEGGLRADRLSFWEVAAQSVATIAPSAIPAMIVPLVFATAGNGTWVAFAFGTLAVILVALNINVFARRVASPGSIFYFVSLGLGPAWGAIAGWSLLIAYFFSGAAVLSGSVHYLEVFFGEVFSWHFTLAASLALAALLVSVIWYFSYHDIKLSTRALLVIEFLVVALIVFLCAVTWWRSGTKIDVAQFTLQGVSADQVRQGLIIAFFGFCGFESATALGGEARNPLKSIPRSILFTVFTVGFFFIASAYVVVLDFHSAGNSLASADAPLSMIANSMGWPMVGTAIAAGVGLSFFACTIANINAGTRVGFALARHGLLPRKIGLVHHLHGSPFVAVNSAIIFVAILMFSFAAFGVPVKNLFDYFATIGAFGALFSYVLVSVAAPVYLFRRKELTAGSVLVAVLSVGLLSVPVTGSLYPVPSWPLNLIPYIFLALIFSGVARLLFLKWKEPATFAAIDRDLVVAKGLIHETTREAPSELSEPLFQPK